MKKLDISKLETDPITKAYADAAGNVATICGYIRGANKTTIEICSDQTSHTFIECPRTAIIAAFEPNENSKKTTFLIKKDASIQLTSLHLAGELNSNDGCGCDDPNSDIGIAEARPWASIDAELAKFKAEIQKIKDFIGTGPGARELKCSQAYHDSLLVAKNQDDIDTAFFTRDLCLAGIDEGKKGNILW